MQIREYPSGIEVIGCSNIHSGELKTKIYLFHTPREAANKFAAEFRILKHEVEYALKTIKSFKKGS